MLASLARIALLIGLAFGGYKLYPRLKPVIQPILTNPKVLGAEIATPVIDTVNKILPDNFQVPTSSRPNETNPTDLSNLTNTVIDSVKQKATEAAGDQIDAAKKEAGNAFCAALIETVKKQCGIP